MRALLAAALLGALFVLASPASAQERVTIAEILPALAGTEIGAIDLGAAPAPGAVRVVRRAEVIAALRAAGRSSDGLAIPSSSRITREARRLDGDAILTLARTHIVEQVAPCEAGDITVRTTATLPSGDVEVRTEGPARPEGTVAMVQVILRAGGREVRVPAQVALRCPAPVVQPGATVRVLVRQGAVRVSATATARQSGRVGDRVRVRVEATGAMVEARVIDGETVEVVR